MPHRRNLSLLPLQLLVAAAFTAALAATDPQVFLEEQILNAAGSATHASSASAASASGPHHSAGSHAGSESEATHAPASDIALSHSGASSHGDSHAHAGSSGNATEGAHSHGGSAHAGGSSSNHTSGGGHAEPAHVAVPAHAWEKDPADIPVTVDPKAKNCINASPYTKPGTHKHPRLVNNMEYLRWLSEFKHANPAPTVRSKAEAHINPHRVLGEFQGYRCIGCQHPLSRIGNLNKLRSDTQKAYDAGLPFRMIAGCIRKVNAQCMTFCYEWVQHDKENKQGLEPPKPSEPPMFPAGPREANTIREYTLMPTPTPTPAPGPEHPSDPNQIRDEANGEITDTCQCSCVTAEPTLANNNPFSCTCSCPPLRGNTGNRGPTGPAGKDGSKGLSGVQGQTGDVGLPGHLEEGTHAMDYCDCYHEHLHADVQGQTLLGCKKPGYLIAGLAKGECVDLSCLDIAKCCVPCLKIDGDPVPEKHVVVAAATPIPAAHGH